MAIGLNYLHALEIEQLQASPSDPKGDFAPVSLCLLYLPDGSIAIRIFVLQKMGWENGKEEETQGEIDAGVGD
ncbi:hypothetical protein ACLOJK_018454 [Asimina triloba]